eukprot:Gb_27023 [translate_table: standard]
MLQHYHKISFQDPSSILSTASSPQRQQLSIPSHDCISHTNIVQTQLLPCPLLSNGPNRATYVVLAKQTLFENTFPN